MSYVQFNIATSVSGSDTKGEEMDESFGKLRVDFDRDETAQTIDLYIEYGEVACLYMTIQRHEINMLANHLQSIINQCE